MFALVSALMFLALLILAGLMTGNEPGATPHPVGWLPVSFLIVSVLPLTSASARRLHDVGLSGWYQVLGCIPYVGPLGIVILLAWPGMPRANRFGEVPPPPRDKPPERARQADPLAAERARLRERFGLPPESTSRAPAIAATPTFDDVGFLARLPWKIIAIFVAMEVLGVSGPGAWASNQFEFDFSWFTPVAGLICGGAGFFAARAAGSPALAGASVAVVDIAVGRSSKGFGQLPQLPDLPAGAFLSVLTMIGLLGALCGLAGGWLANPARVGAAT